MRPPRLRCTLFSLIYPPHLLGSYKRQLYGFVLFSRLTKRNLASYVISVRRTKSSLTASFRFYLTIDTLAVQLYTSLSPRRVRDFHPLERAHGAQTKNRRSFLNVYIIERLVLSHMFYYNRYNSCLSPCIFVVFITCVIYNLHVVGKKSLIDIPHWPEHYEVLSYHFWPAYRQNRLSVFVPEDRCIPLGEI